MINKNQLSTEDYEICSKLKSMRFSGMAEALEEVFADPNAELLSFREKYSVSWMQNGICAIPRN